MHSRIMRWLIEGSALCEAPFRLQREERALSTDPSNESPLGGRETDWLVTVPRPEDLLFLVFVAPDCDFQSYNHTFQVMLDSVRFRR
jgi:hypothetical protein